MIEDATASGVPLPHPDNPARADAARIRNALVVIDGRQVSAGETASDLAAALAAETLARQQADADEVTARQGAMTAEKNAREAADTALQDAINSVPTFDPAGYYTKTQVDAAMALKASASELSMLALIALDASGAGNAVDMPWDYCLHNDMGSVDPALSVDTAAPSPVPLSYLPYIGNSRQSSWLSNTSFAGITLSMSPAPSVAGSEYKATDATDVNGPTSNGTNLTWEMALAIPSRVDQWTGYPVLASARTGTMYFEGYRSGAWATLDSVNFASSTAPTASERVIAPTENLYDKFRYRIEITSGGAVNVTWDALGFQRYPSPEFVTYSQALPSVPVTIQLWLSASLQSSVPSDANIAADISRDNGASWTNVGPLTLLGQSGGVFATPTIGHFRSGVVTMTGPTGSTLRIRIRSKLRAASTLRPQAAMLKWTV